MKVIPDSSGLSFWKRVFSLLQEENNGMMRRHPNLKYVVSLLVILFSKFYSLKASGSVLVLYFPSVQAALGPLIAPGGGGIERPG